MVIKFVLIRNRLRSNKGIPAIGDRRGEAVPASGVNGAAGTGNMDPTPNPL
jgi:hypothetical protein